MRKSMSLKTRLILQMLSLVLITIAAIGLLSGYQSRKLILTGVEESAHNKVDAAVQRVEGYLSGLSGQMDAFAVSRSLKSFDRAAMEPEMRAMLQRNPSVTNVYAGFDQNADFFVFMNENGQIKEWKAPADFDPRSRGWYKDAKAKGKIGISAPYQDTATKEMVISIFAPFFDKTGAFLGVAGEDILLSDLTSFIAKLTFGKEGYALMVDKEGVIVAHPDPKMLATKITEKQGRLAEIGRQMIAGKSGTDTYTLDGVEKRIFFQPIASVGWSIAVAMPEKEINAPVSTLFTWVAIIGLAALLITGALVLWSAIRIVRPINRVGGQLEAVAQGGGDLTQRLDVAVRDEVGNLACWFNAFMQKLASIVSDVAGTARHVDEGSVQLATAVQQQADVTAQMAALVAEVARGAQEQTRTVHEAQHALASLTTSIDEIARGAGSQAATVEQTRLLTSAMEEGVGRAVSHIRTLSTTIDANAGSAAKGHGAVQAVVGSMQGLRSGMNETLSCVAQLDEGSRQIGAIIEAITDIANQTNMLALNAAIEAARAGEHGKGFAVVAEEVRSLAEKSRSSTAEIGEIIKGLSVAIGATVQAMQAAGHQVQEGGRLAEQAGQFLEVIARDAAAARISTSGLMDLAVDLDQRSKAVGSAMGNLAAVAEETSALTEEMAGTSGSVVEAVGRIARISQENAAGAEQGAAAAEELSASSEEITATAESLAKAAESLKALVGRFKVK